MGRADASNGAPEGSRQRQVREAAQRHERRRNGVVGGRRTALARPPVRACLCETERPARGVRSGHLALFIPYAGASRRRRRPDALDRAWPMPGARLDRGLGLRLESRPGLVARVGPAARVAPALDSPTVSPPTRLLRSGAARQRSISPGLEPQSHNPGGRGFESCPPSDAVVVVGRHRPAVPGDGDLRSQETVMPTSVDSVTSASASRVGRDVEYSMGGSSCRSLSVWRPRRV